MTDKISYRRLGKEHAIPVCFSVSILIMTILVMGSYSNAGVVKGRITSVQGNAIELSLGSDRGIKQGDSGRVYYTVTIDDKEKQIYVAKFQISRVSDRSSTAQIQEKTMEVRTGFLVEVTVMEGEMEIRSDPSGAKVYVDGKEVGTAPVVLPHVKPGKYVVRLIREGYETYEERVNVIEGERKKILASMRRAVGELSINTDPSGASVYLDGKSVGVSPYEGKDVAPRSYKIRIEKEGYAVWEKTEVVEIGKKAEVLAQLRAKEGGLEILSEPSGARIYLDGKEREQTPFVLSGVQLGEHLVRVVKEGYEQYEERVSVTAGERKKVIVPLRRIVGALSVRTEPSGARVYIDGKQVGTSPHEAKDLSPGAHNVRIEKEGYTSWEGIETVIAGKRVEVPIELKTRVGHLEVLSEPAGAKVFLDGKEMGQTPLSLPDLRTGEHQVRVTREGYETYEEEVRIIEGKNRVSASLRRARGDLSIDTEPPHSDIYINEKPVGTSPYEGKDVLPGTYKIRVNKEGYETREMDVVIKAGESNKLRIELKEKRKEVAAAQRPRKVPTVGYLSPMSGSAGPPSPNLEAFLQGLKELGYVEGKNIAIEYRFAEGKYERLPKLAAELARLKMDIIVTETGTVAVIAKTATRTIPIVMGASGDPVSQGLVASLAHPGGNVTGLTSLSPATSGKRLQLLTEVVSKLTHVGVLWNGGDSPVTDREWAETRAAAQPLNVQLSSLLVRDPAEFPSAFAKAARQHIQAVLMFDVPVWGTFTASARIAELALQNHLPMISLSFNFAERGGLMSYGANSFELYRRAATYVDRILKGANPADLPVEQATKFVLIINLKTAKALGLTIPQSVLTQADRVIE
jgi:putative ABC transport system substrate-binding protein